MMMISEGFFQMLMKYSIIFSRIIQCIKSGTENLLKKVWKGGGGCKKRGKSAKKYQNYYLDNFVKYSCYTNVLRGTDKTHQQEIE